jgi:hypothetical protein
MLPIGQLRRLQRRLPARRNSLSTAEANTAAMEALNAKIDQVFRKRPTE